MGQLGIRIRRQLEETVVRPAPKRLALRARVVQESHERLRIRSRGRRGNPNPTALAALQKEGNRDVRAGARQEVQVSPGGRRVEPIHAVVERLRPFRRGRRFGDLLQPLRLGLQVPHTGLDPAKSLAVLGLEPSDFGALLRDLVELPPGAPRTVEVPPPRFPEGHIKDRNEPQRETLVLGGLREVRRDCLDVPREDPHLAPVVDLAIAYQPIDPFAEAIQRAVKDPGDALDFLPRAGDRFEQAGSLGFEGRGGQRVGRRHEEAAMEARTYLASFGRRSKPSPPRSSYPFEGDAGPWRLSRTSVTSSSPLTTWKRVSRSTATSSVSGWSARGAPYGLRSKRRAANSRSGGPPRIPRLPPSPKATQRPSRVTQPNLTRAPLALRR